MDNDTAVKKTLLSGIQPSGDLHLGNYLGAVKSWAALPDEFNCFYFMADLHTLTVRQNPAELRRRSTTQLAQYIACGLDPENREYREAQMRLREQMQTGNAGNADANDGCSLCHLCTGLLCLNLCCDTRHC